LFPSTFVSFGICP